MITDKELAEYRSLYTALGDLHKKFLKRKREILELMEETAFYKRKALLILSKTNRVVRHLTSRQRQIAGIAPCLKKPPISNKPLIIEEPETRLPEFEANCRNIREVKQQGLLLLALIDTIKNKLLQLDLLELRCRELILSIKKALEAFHYESKIIRKKLYPFGIFSHLYRFFRRVFGIPYFTFRDMEDVAALGKFSGLVLKIADSPLA